jgi:uncharacterized membrane protein YraQ (UPF0718 family)
MFLGFISIVSIVLLIVYPEKREVVVSVSKDFFLEILFILPAVMVLMGLFAVFVRKDLVVSLLGKESGLKGVLIAVIMGALPTGPLYVAFPIASTLLKRGARILNIVVFLTAWSCIKIPQEIVEIEFLGFRFMLTRLFLTILFAILMGFVIERILVRWSREG